MIKRTALTILLSCLSLTTQVIADTVTPAATETVVTTPASSTKTTITLAYVELAEDARYDEKRMAKEFLGQALGRPYSAAELALKEIKFHGASANVEFVLQAQQAKDSNDLIKQVEALYAAGVRFVIADLPAKDLLSLAQSFKGKDLVFFNISAKEDELRQTQCQANIFHTIPNLAMQADGLVQYLVSQKWREILVLQGPAPEDQLLVNALQRAAKRYGAKLLDIRPFILGSDPREREKNNIALLTNGTYDVVYIADSDGEFARNANYQTQLARPVVGSAGLNALAWNWAWERHGAPQVEKRFAKQAKRHMTDLDWAAWMAIKAVGVAVQQTQSADFNKILSYLQADSTNLDGAKGNPSSFRPWDHQLRQPLLISTHNWVIERAPLQGFLHQSNNLDTLGFDKPDSQCQF